MVQPVATPLAAAMEPLVEPPRLATVVPLQRTVLLRPHVVPLQLLLLVVLLLPPTVPLLLTAVLPLLAVAPLLLVVVPRLLVAPLVAEARTAARLLLAVSLSGSTRHRLPATPRTAVLRSAAWASVTALATRKSCALSSTP